MLFWILTTSVLYSLLSGVKLKVPHIVTILKDSYRFNFRLKNFFPKFGICESFKILPKIPDRPEVQGKPDVMIPPFLSVQLKFFWIWFLYWSAAGPAWVLMQFPSQLIVDISKWSAILIVLELQASNCLLTAGCIAWSWARFRPSCSKSFVARLIFCWTDSTFSWMKPFQKCLFTKGHIVYESWIMSHVWVICVPRPWLWQWTEAYLVLLVWFLGE